jgi:hypothetical protein
MKKTAAVRPARATCSPYSGSRSLRLQTIFHCATSCLMIVCSCCVDMSSLSNTCQHRYFQMFHVVYRTCCTLSLALGSCALIMLFHQALNPVRFSSMFVTLGIRALNHHVDYGLLVGVAELAYSVGLAAMFGNTVFRP